MTTQELSMVRAGAEVDEVILDFGDGPSLVLKSVTHAYTPRFMVDTHDKRNHTHLLKWLESERDSGVHTGVAMAVIDDLIRFVNSDVREERYLMVFITEGAIEHIGIANRLTVGSKVRIERPSTNQQGFWTDTVKRFIVHETPQPAAR